MRMCHLSTFHSQKYAGCLSNEPLIWISYWRVPTLSKEVICFASAVICVHTQQATNIWSYKQWNEETHQGKLHEAWGEAVFPNPLKLGQELVQLAASEQSYTWKQNKWVRNMAVKDTADTKHTAAETAGLEVSSKNIFSSGPSCSKAG